MEASSASRRFGPSGKNSEVSRPDYRDPGNDEVSIGNRVRVTREI
jgi:hypothetical protein